MTHRANHEPRPHRAKLAGFLTELRRGAELTYEEMADRLKLGGRELSPSTLKRAAGTRSSVPKEPTVSAFVIACVGSEIEQGAQQYDAAGGNVMREALGLWRKAKIEERGKLEGLHAPSPANIRTDADMTAALAAAYELAGAPPLRTLQQRAGYTGAPADDPAAQEQTMLSGAPPILPVSTAWRIVKRRGQPTNLQQVEAFLRGCGITSRAMPEWRRAWERTLASSPPPVAPRAAPSPNYGSQEGQADQVGANQSALATLLAQLSPKDVDEVLRGGLALLINSKGLRNGTAVPNSVGSLTRDTHVAVKASSPDTSRVPVPKRTFARAGRGPDRPDTAARPDSIGSIPAKPSKGQKSVVCAARRSLPGFAVGTSA
ncbi:hypothetical protein [Streptomyces sp. NPDC048639]|uniref:hypothetical protein n=1 Tax=Streptomyces sp. NPDC048639 TaxID=3365581 RepID=UPI0037135F2F